jgi:hypothetical protein
MPEAGEEKIAGEVSKVDAGGSLSNGRAGALTLPR